MERDKLLKNKSVFNIICLAGMFMAVTACSKYSLPEEAYLVQSGSDMLSLNIPDGFNYQTTMDLEFSLLIKENQGLPLQSVPFRLYTLSEDQELVYIKSGMTDEYGSYKDLINLDIITKEIILSTTYPGIPSPQLIKVDDRKVDYIIDPFTPPLSIDSIYGKSNGSPALSFRSPLNLNFTYLGLYNTQGVPDYLEPQNDPVGQAILDLVNNSLPEGQPVPDYNPQYIANGNAANLEVEDDADVWITFVHEGAGYRNALGYYTYPTNSPPTQVADIQQFNVIFPNASYAGGGGGLTTGNKVYLGTFSPGTTIGWFLVPNGWDASQQLVVEQDGKDVKFSNSNLNTFTTQPNQSHAVLLEDPVQELLFLGIEDINRPGGDKDFNDAVFYITANPYEAINTGNLPAVQTTINDSDGDGVQDNSDDFINDPDIAFASYVPGENTYNSLAFEDRWPALGDYDMNDMVVNYNFAEFRNAGNQVIKIRGTLILQAMGAGLRNGFGFEMDIAPSAISSVNGQKLFENYISLDANGTESNQSNAVIIAFDNGFKLMNNQGGFVNTVETDPFITPDTLLIDITLTNPMPAGQLGAPPYNPFIITGMRRGYEVHLPDLPPTDLADITLFQTESDDSNPQFGNYYKTSNNLPWAIHLSNGFDYPKEKEPLNTAYYHFDDWAVTAGLNYPDWHKDLSGYRNFPKIY